jgi:hypothetical protein
MPVFYVSGDPLLTHSQVLAFGHNARGRTQSGKFDTALMSRYPAAFSLFRKQCRKDRIRPGTIWFWRESLPALGFMVVRESSSSATRLRHVQSAILTLARDYRLERVESLAIAPLGNQYEWPEIRQLVDTWLGKSPFPVVVYDSYLPGVQADEGWNA